MWSDDDEYFTYSPHYYGSDDDIIDSDDDLNFSFDDDDYTYCHSVGSDEERVLYPSLLLSKSGHWEVKKHENTASSVAVSSPVYQVQSLVDSCSRFIAVSFPFAYLEHRCPPIPDELQMKVIKFSFPEDKEMIRKYAEFSRSNVDFSYASTLHKNGSVKDLNQIGFRLSAKVNDRRNPGRRGSNEGYYVTIHFDRGKITSAHCSCDLTSNWCEHAIATCLARINDSEKMMVHLPVSDSLNLLNREQLLKFTQYLLCEHQNEQVVDSAQQLLDRLLSRQQKGKEEDINSIAGAPDPTAGPGLDEESHWFVCKSGFKSRCESLVYESWEDLGFVMYRHTNNDRGSSVHEAWKRNMFRSTLIRDEMDQELDHGFSSERQRHSVLQVLEMTEDLLQDDYMSAFAALSVCTEQLIERLNKLCCKKSSRDLFSPSRNQQHDVVKFGGSLAGGFTPRISRTLIDELSRLWRLTVINPRVPAKQRPAITSRLRSFTEEAAKAFNSSTLLLEPWLGLEVALRLSRINWATLQFQRVLRGEWVHFPVVSSRMAIHLDYQWNCVDVAHEAGMEVDDPKDTSSGMNPRVTELAVFYNPHCISVDPCCNIDIHSLCCKIETLRANTNHKPAIRLAVAVSCGLVSYYKNLLCGNRDVETIPVSAKCFLGRKRGNTSVPQGFTEAAMEVDEGHKEANNSHVWPEDTLLSITTLAFLFDQLSLESDLVESCLVEMKTKLGLASLPEQQIGLDCLCSAQSLRFQLGIHGLFMHRLPAPSQHGEVEQFETECWLTYRLIGCSPGQNDLMLLTQLGRHVISERTLPGVPPPYSLARVIVYHLFKCASAGLCKSLTKDQTLGLSVAFYVLASDNTIVKEGVNMAWLMFQYANLRLRAKLANVVLHCVADSEEFLEKAMSCILKPNGMVGVPSADELSMRTCGRELFDAKGRVLYCLARSLGGKRMDLADTTRMDLKRKLAQRSRNVRWSTSKECDVVEAETPRKIMKSGVEKALNLCAVRIGAHSVWLQSGVNRRYSQGETVRWLIEFAVNSGIDCVICLTKFEGGIHALLKQTEVFDLCDKVLKKEEKQSQSIVQEVLFSQLQKNSQSESSEEMMAVISFCRENRCASKLDLLPWICQELQSFKDKGSFLPFEVLMHASQAMFLHYREILNSAENRKRQWAQDGSLCLERLFNQGAPLGDDSDEEDEGRLSATQNPYRLPEAHPFLETAFDLGMNGLEKLRNRSDDLDRDGLPYYRCPVREHLEKFCKYAIDCSKKRLAPISNRTKLDCFKAIVGLVCYLGEKKWLITTAPKRPSRIHLSRRDDQSITAAKPGCSKWDDDYLQCVSREPRDSCYLHKFICCLINCVDNPLWLFSVLQELGDHLHIKGERQRAVPRQELQNLQMKEACRSYMSIKLLLQKVLDAFSKLLLGPKMAELVDDITTRQSERRLETSEVLYELSHSVLFNTRLREVLKVAKRAFSLSDSSASFMSLVREMTSRHSVMESFLDLVMQDKECETEDRDIIMYPHGNLRLTDFVAHRLFPGLFAGSPNNDFFYG